MPLRIAGFVLVLSGAASALAQELWSTPLDAPAAHAPLVVDVDAAPGPETFAVLTSGKVIALLADGKPLWEASLGGAVSAGAQSAAAGAIEIPLLAIPAVEGSIHALDARSGATVWKAAAGAAAQWLIMADLNEDQVPDVLAAAPDGALAALNGVDGSVLWSTGPAETPLAGTPALADIDDDGLPEIFCADRAGLRVLDATGEELRAVAIDGGLHSAPVIGDNDDDGAFEVYVLTKDRALAAINAAEGEELWRTPLDLAASPAPSLALADLDQDESGEVIVAGANVAIVAADGKPLFSMAAPGHGPALADLNGDGELELGFAGEKIVLRDPALGPVSESSLASRAALPPVAAALGSVTLLIVSEDNVLRALRTGPRLMPQLQPWPAPRRDATGRGAALSPLREMDMHRDGPQLAAASAAIGLATGFEDTASTATWVAEGGTLAHDTATRGAGTASLAITPSGAELRVLSPWIDVDPAVRTMSASVLVHGAEAQAKLLWARAEGPVAEQALRPADTTPEGWKRHRLSNAPKPAGARRVRLAIAFTAADGPVHVDEVQAIAQSRSVPFVEVYINRAGYELRAPKQFTAAATFPAPGASFRVLNEAGEAVHEAGLGAPARITGANGADWGKHYWRGDFSTVDEPGKYRIEVDIDGNRVQTPAFEIGPDLLWARLFAPLTRAIHALRAAPGEAKAWQTGLDDAAVLRTLAEAYQIILWRLRDPEAKGEHPLLAEVRWGAEHLLARADAMAQPGAPGAAVYAAAMADAARLLPDAKAIAEAARTIYAACAQDETAKPLLFRAVLDLYGATNDAALLPEIERLYPGPDPALAEALVRYEGRVDDMRADSFAAGGELAKQVEAMIDAADNPFGIVPGGSKEARAYFPGDAARGNLDDLLAAALAAAKAFRFSGKPEHQQLALAQINWILGCNPFGISLVNGIGLPDSGLAPEGAVADIIGAEAPGVDRPALRSSTPPEHFRHTLGLLEVLANLKRIRTGSMH